MTLPVQVADANLVQQPSGIQLIPRPVPSPSIVGDRYVDGVKRRLFERQIALGGIAQPLPLHLLLAELRDLFQRHTFTEPIEECRDKDCGARFCSLCLTLDTL